MFISGDSSRKVSKDVVIMASRDSVLEKLKRFRVNLFENEPYFFL